MMFIHTPASRFRLICRELGWDIVFVMVVRERPALAMSGARALARPALIAERLSLMLRGSALTRLLARTWVQEVDA